MDIQLILRQKQVLDLVLSNQAEEILYGGAAGGGKSYLLRAMAIIWSVLVPGIQIFLFRRKVKDLISTHLLGPSSFQNLLREYTDNKLCKINNSSNYIEFVNGSHISLNHCQHDNDLNNFLSAEFHILLLDESTTFTEKMIRFLRSRLRVGSLKVPEEYRNCLPFAIYGTNPRGVSHGYFKSKFVDAAPHESIFVAADDDGAMKRAFIPSKLADNPHIEKGYANKLRGLGDPDVVEAYLAGDWSVIEGAAFEKLRRDVHEIPRKRVCPSWKVYRAYDYGFSAPYFVIWYKIATGESSTDWCPPKGTIILDTEIYGADDDDRGLKEDVKVTATRMRMHEELYYPGVSIHAGPADNSIFDKEQGPSIAKQISDKEPSITFELSDKTPGSRILGISEFRTRLFAVIQDRHGAEGIYFTEYMIKAFAQIASLVTDDKNIEDVDTEQNDHSWDVIRYIVLSKNKEITFTEVHGA